MIKELEIRNFQSHEHSIFTFEKGINVIVGSSDSGKTASLRALFWVIENRPMGAAHVSWWAKKQTKSGKTQIEDACEVSVTLDSKDQITRYRSEDANNYFITRADGKEIVFDAPKSEVPESVTGLFNLSEVNIGKQMDSPFLVSSTSGEVARFLNRVLRLDQIDQVLSKIESDRRSLNKDVESGKKEIEEIEAYIREYKWIDDAEPLVSKLEKTQNKILWIQKTADKLETQIEQYGSLQDSMPRIPNLQKTEKLIQDIRSVRQKIQSTEERAESVERSINKYIDLKNSLPNFDYNQVLEEINKVSVVVEQIKSLKKLFNTLSVGCDQYEKLESDLQENTLLIKNLSDRLPNVCPTCGQFINEEIKNAITHSI